MYRDISKSKKLLVVFVVAIINNLESQEMNCADFVN